MNPMHPESDGDRVPRRSFLLSALFLCPKVRLLRAAQDTTFSTDVKVVNVLATVSDKQGQIIGNLTKDDFTLTRTGVPRPSAIFRGKPICRSRSGCWWTPA